MSVSETWYAVTDHGTNYCNLYNLIEGNSLHTQLKYFPLICTFTFIHTYMLNALLKSLGWYLWQSQHLDSGHELKTLTIGLLLSFNMTKIFLHSQIYRQERKYMWSWLSFCIGCGLTEAPGYKEITSEFLCTQRSSANCNVYWCWRPFKLNISCRWHINIMAIDICMNVSYMQCV